MGLLEYCDLFSFMIIKCIQKLEEGDQYTVSFLFEKPVIYIMIKKEKPHKTKALVKE